MIRSGSHLYQRFSAFHTDKTIREKHFIVFLMTGDVLKLRRRPFIGRRLSLKFEE